MNKMDNVLRGSGSNFGHLRNPKDVCSQLQILPSLDICEKISECDGVDGMRYDMHCSTGKESWKFCDYEGGKK